MTYLRYFASIFIWQFLNPFGIRQSILQNGGQAIAILRARVSKIRPSGISMSLPFSGYWEVVNGGVDKQASHSWNLITQRYAYDFVFPGRDGKKYEGNGRKAAEYHGFGQDVLAPADGTVVRVQKRVRDYPYAATGSVDVLARDFRGNHVIIRHGEHVYSFIAHLRKGSLTVRPGDPVTRGQVIGLCGNSGHSTEPHVHFHLQDRANFFLAVGLPIPFENVEIKSNASQEGKRLRRGYISKGCLAGNSDPGAEPPGQAHETHDEIQPAKGQLFPLVTGFLNALGLTVWVLLLYMWLIRPLLRAAVRAFGGG